MGVRVKPAEASANIKETKTVGKQTVSEQSGVIEPPAVALNVEQLASVSVSFARSVQPVAFESVRVEVSVQLPVPAMSYQKHVTDLMDFTESIVNQRALSYRAVHSPTTDSLDDVLVPENSVPPRTYSTNQQQTNKPVIPKTQNNKDSIADDLLAGLDDLI